MHAIDPVFDLLDRWRHLPAYQLERRADVYFALYLPEVLEAVTGTPIDPRLVPELPFLSEGEQRAQRDARKGKQKKGGGSKSGRHKGGGHRKRKRKSGR